MVDSKGTVMHVFPHRDSRDTMVNSNTKRILIIACRVPGVEEEKVREAAELARRLISESCRRDLQSC
ncbi:MAG: hypothetical protein HA489_04195 [Archaeoglobales archaeon]|nr:hypothetical protein [Archaeoglobales archaeon]